MSIRGSVWLQLGDPIDGFRFGPPLHSEWAVENPDIFQQLEVLIEEVYKILVHQPLTRWKGIAEFAKPYKINGRRVRMDIRCYGDKDGDSLVIMRARLPFRVWPLGGWVVVDGWNVSPAGDWTPLPTEEVEKGW